MTRVSRKALALGLLLLGALLAGAGLGAVYHSREELSAYHRWKQEATPEAKAAWVAVRKSTQRDEALVRGGLIVAAFVSSGTGWVVLRRTRRQE